MTEVGYLDGVTSAIQTQLGAKANHTGGTLTSPTVSGGTINNTTIGATTATTGKFTTVTASTGILFGTDTAAANTLDDYEEGTWTPAITGSTGVTYTVQSGHYTKTGNNVTAYCNLSFQKTGDSTGLGLSGLPFSHSSNALYEQSISLIDNLTSPLGCLNFQISASATNGIFVKNLHKTGAHSQLLSSDLTNSVSITIRTTIIYQAA